MMIAVYDGTWYVVDEITKEYIILRGLSLVDVHDVVTNETVHTYTTNEYTHKLDLANDKRCKHCGAYDSFIKATFPNGSEVLVCASCDKVTY